MQILRDRILNVNENDDFQDDEKPVESAIIQKALEIIDQLDNFPINYPKAYAIGDYLGGINLCWGKDKTTKVRLIIRANETPSIYCRVFYVKNKMFSVFTSMTKIENLALFLKIIEDVQSQ